MSSTIFEKRQQLVYDINDFLQYVLDEIEMGTQPCSIVETSEFVGSVEEITEDLQSVCPEFVEEKFNDAIKQLTGEIGEFDVDDFEATLNDVVLEIEKLGYETRHQFEDGINQYYEKDFKVSAIWNSMGEVSVSFGNSKPDSDNNGEEKYITDWLPINKFREYVKHATENHKTAWLEYKEILTVGEDFIVNLLNSVSTEGSIDLADVSDTEIYVAAFDIQNYIDYLRENCSLELVVAQDEAEKEWFCLFARVEIEYGIGYNNSLFLIQNELDVLGNNLNKMRGYCIYLNDNVSEELHTAINPNVSFFDALEDDIEGTEKDADKIGKVLLKYKTMQCKYSYIQKLVLNSDGTKELAETLQEPLNQLSLRMCLLQMYHFIASNPVLSENVAHYRKAYEIDVFDVGFSYRTSKLLKDSGILNVGDLSNLTSEKLQEIPSLGNVEFEEIVRKLDGMGYSLDDYSEDEYSSVDEFIQDKTCDFTYEEKYEDIMELKTDKKVLEVIIEQLDFSVRTYNCLKRAGINTVEDMLQCSESDMMKVRNMGRRSLEEIKRELKSLGLELKRECEYCAETLTDEELDSFGDVCSECWERVARVRKAKDVVLDILPPEASSYTGGYSGFHIYINVKNNTNAPLKLELQECSILKGGRQQAPECFLTGYTFYTEHIFPNSIKTFAKIWKTTSWKNDLLEFEDDLTISLKTDDKIFFFKYKYNRTNESWIFYDYYELDS